jgi:peptidoglycan/xylan/chitin deacetylase (PgdA/CDA1 family)
MQEFGFIGTIFVITGYVGKLNKWDVNLGNIKFKHLDWKQIRELHKAGFEIESHTVHHADLTRIPLSIVQTELDISKKEIEDQINCEVKFISFPFGRYNANIVEISKSCGYIKGCGFLTGSEERKKSFVLERKAYYFFDGLWSLNAKLSNNIWSVFEDLKLRAINFCSYGTSLVKPTKFNYY